MGKDIRDSHHGLELFGSLVSGATRRLCMVPVDDAGRNPHRSQKRIELEANRC